MTRTALWGILLVMAVLCGWGMTADLPYTRLGIERLHIQLALKYSTGDLNPHYFIHPPLLSYLLFVLYGVTFLIGRLMGLVPSVAAFERLYFTDPSVFFVIARVFIMAVALGSVMLFCRIGVRLFGIRSAFIATLFVAWAPELVKWAHYALPTVLMLCVFMAAFYFVVRIFQGGGWRDSLCAGFLGGLAIAAKYDGGAIMLPLVSSHVLAPSGAGCPGWRWKRILASLACVGFGFLVGNPFAPLEVHTFLKDLGLIYRVVDGRMVVPGFRVHQPGWMHLVTNAMPFGWGLPLTLLGLLGVAYGLYRRRREDVLLLSFILPVLCYVSWWRAINPRYLLHVVPFMILLGVECCVELTGKLITSSQRQAVVLAVGSTLLLALPLSRSIAFNQEVARQPLERVAMEWIEANIPTGAAIVTLPDLPLVPNARSIQRQLAEIQQKRLGEGVRLKRLLAHLGGFPITYDVTPLPLFTMGTFDVSDYDFDRYATSGVQYFIVNEDVDEYRADPKTFAVQLRYVQAVQEHCQLLQEFRRPWPSLEPPRSSSEEYLQIYKLASRP